MFGKNPRFFIPGASFVKYVSSYPFRALKELL
jgi:hypothetical protein